MENKSRIVTGRFKINIEGITEEEIFDSLIETFKRNWGTDFNLEVIGRKDISEKHI